MEGSKRSEEKPAKRHCPTRPFSEEMARNQAQLYQLELESGPFNNNQPWSYPPQQLTPQPEWSSFYNINNNRGNTLGHLDNAMAGYPNPTPFPTQLGPMQQGQVQQALIEPGQMQLEPILPTPSETTGYMDDFNQTFPTNYVGNMGWSQTNHAFQAPQGVMNGFYPPPPQQQQNQFQFDQQPWTPEPALLDLSMPMPHIWHAVNTNHGPPAIGRNIPQRAPFYPTMPLETTQPKCHVVRYAIGGDITRLWGQRRRLKKRTPSLKKKKDKTPKAIVPPQPEPALPESAGDHPGQVQQHEEHTAEIEQPNSVDSWVVIDDPNDPAPEEFAPANAVENPAVVDDGLEGLGPIKEFLERAKQKDVDAADQADKAPGDEDKPEEPWRSVRMPRSTLQALTTDGRMRILCASDLHRLAPARILARSRRDHRALAMGCVRRLSPI